MSTARLPARLSANTVSSPFLLTSLLLLSLLTIHLPCRHTTLSTLEFGTNCSSARRCLRKAIETCAAQSSWQAYDLSTARSGWTAQPHSVPSRMSARNRDNFADLDHLGLELVCTGIVTSSRTARPDCSIRLPILQTAYAGCHPLNESGLMLTPTAHLGPGTGDLGDC